jgi:hypothetical protein
MRKAGADPTGNIKRIMGMLEEQTGGKFTPKQAREELKYQFHQTYYYVLPTYQF